MTGRGSEGSSGVWGLISLLVIIVASCCTECRSIPITGWLLASQAASTSGHSSAQDNTTQHGQERCESPQESRLVGSFLASCAMATHNCCRTPRMAAEVRRRMYMWCCYQHAVPMCQGASSTHSALKPTGAKKKRRKENSCCSCHRPLTGTR